LTPFGNPQNLLVSLGSGLSTPISTFLRYRLLPTAMNLFVVGQAERAGVRISLRQLVNFGAPLAAVALVVTYGFLWLGV
jgi:Na+/H+ antiporter NhaD/arsenite permease-like protein